MKIETPDGTPAITQHEIDHEIEGFRRWQMSNQFSSDELIFIRVALCEWGINRQEFAKSWEAIGDPEELAVDARSSEQDARDLVHKVSALMGAGATQ
jgi:hypothetical protein